MPLLLPWTALHAHSMLVISATTDAHGDAQFGFGSSLSKQSPAQSTECFADWPQIVEVQFDITSFLEVLCTHSTQ